MGKVTKFLVKLIPPNTGEMAPTPAKINLKDKVEDGEIDLSMSDIQDVPVKDIATIKKAHSLDLSNNHISILPKNFATLNHLIKLDLSKNELKELPENFGDLIKLKHLDLYKNQLQHLPLSFGKLKDLKWLDLKDNLLVPAIANIAGPCLESKQCQKCAKDIVTFYSQLQIKVGVERQLREEQRQKDLHNNAQKLKQEKKKKKDKKDKIITYNESRQTSTGGLEVLDDPNIAKFDKNSQTEPKTKDSKSGFVFRYIKWSFITIFLLAVTLFLLTAAKVTFVQIVEDTMIECWNNFLTNLPSDLQDVGVQAGENVKSIHEWTGNGIEMIASYICDLSQNGSINIIFNEFTDVFKNATQMATEVYIKVFGG